MASNAVAHIFPKDVRKGMIKSLINSLGWAKRVKRNMTKKFVKSTEGDSITIELPFETDSVYGRVMKTQPTALRTTSIKIDMHQHYAFETNLIDMTIRNSDGDLDGTYLHRGLQNIADKVDADVAFKLAAAAPMVMGDAGPAPLSPREFEKVQTALFQLGVMSDDGRLHGGFSPGSLHNFTWGPEAGNDPAATAERHNLDRQFGYNGLVSGLAYSKIPKILKDGFYKGPISNIDLFQSNNVAKRTVGGKGTAGGAFTGGTQTSFYNANATYAYVNGANQRGNELVTDGWAPHVVLKRGDKVILDGVYRVNPVRRKRVNQNACFSVAEDCKADGNGNMTIKLYQEIITDDSYMVDPDQTSNPNHYFNEHSNIRMGLEDYAGQLYDEPTRTDGHPTGNPADEPYVVSQTAKGRSLSAYRNHDKQIPDNTKIKVIGMFDEEYDLNVVFHDTCGIFANPMLKKSMGTPGAQNRLNLGAFGFNMLLSYGEDITTLGSYVRADLVWAFNVILSERTVAYYTQNESLNQVNFDA